MSNRETISREKTNPEKDAGGPLSSKRKEGSWSAGRHAEICSPRPPVEELLANLARQAARDRSSEVPNPQAGPSTDRVIGIPTQAELEYAKTFFDFDAASEVLPHNRVRDEKEASTSPADVPSLSHKRKERAATSDYTEKAASPLTHEDSDFQNDYEHPGPIERMQREPYTKEELEEHIRAFANEMKENVTPSKTRIATIWQNAALTTKELMNIRDILLALRDDKSNKDITYDNYEKINLVAKYSNPTYKARQAAGRAAYEADPKIKAKRAAYEADPKIKARKAAREADPAYKAKRAAYEADPKIKARRAARRADPEIKVRQAERRAELKAARDSREANKDEPGPSSHPS